MLENKLLSPKLILIFIIIFSAIIAGLSVTGYLSSVKNTPPIVVQPTEEPTITSTPIVTAEQTVMPTPKPTVILTPASNIDIPGWEIYRNEEYGYKISYPAIATFVVKKESSLDKNIVQQRTDFIFDENSFINVSVWLDKSPIDETYMNDHYEKFFIDEKNALKGVEFGAPYDAIETIIFGNNYIYQIEYQGEKNQKFIDYYNEAIFTFKFIK